MNQTITYPASRLATLDIGRLGAEQHTVAGLIEVDVTQARGEIRAAIKVGEEISFNAWFVKCVADTAAEFPGAHALPAGRRRLQVSKSTDIAFTVERSVDGVRVPLVAVVRGAETKSIADVKQELDRASGKGLAGPEDYVLSEHRRSPLAMKLFYRLPQVLRLLVFRRLMKNPAKRRAEMGSIMITNAGAIGRTPGWILPKTIHPLALALGPIVKKPRVVAHEILPREILHLTILFDHDLIDGLPAARFSDKLVRRLESGLR